MGGRSVSDLSGQPAVSYGEAVAPVTRFNEFNAVTLIHKVGAPSQA